MGNTPWLRSPQFQKANHFPIFVGIFQGLPSPSPSPAGHRSPSLRPDRRGLRVRTPLRSAEAAGIDGQPGGDPGADHAIAGATSGELDLGWWCQLLMGK